MRVLIPGGSGMLGRRLAAISLRTARGRSAEPHPRAVGPLPEVVSAVQWDGRTADGRGHLADGAAAIINLAGESIAGGRWTAERRRAIVESRTNAGAAVVDAVKGATVKPKLVIQISGVGYYGPQGSQQLTESDGPGSDFGARRCACSGRKRRRRWKRSAYDEP